MLSKLKGLLRYKLNEVIQTPQLYLFLHIEQDDKTAKASK